jgi:hypothetical protein
LTQIVSPNLVRNGGFETGTPESWLLSDVPQAAAKIVPLPGDAGGGHAAEFRATVPMALGQDVSLVPGGEYTLSARVLLPAGAQGADPFVRVLSAGAPLGGSYVCDVKAGDGGWRTVRVPFRAIAAAMSVVFGTTRTSDKCIVQVDDVVLSPLAPPPGQEGALRVVFLDDLPPIDVHVGHGKLGLRGDMGYEGHRVMLGTLRTNHAVSAHPQTNGQSHVSFVVPEGFRLLRATAMNNSSRTRAATPLTFTVEGDVAVEVKGKTTVEHRTLASVRPFTSAVDPISLEVDLTGVRKLTLRVKCPGSYQDAHTVWWEARLIGWGAPGAGRP